MTYNMEWLIRNYGPFFSKFGINADELAAHFEDWKSQSNESSIKEYLWYLFHVLIGETKKQVTQPGDLYRNMHEIYVQMLEFRVNEEGQKDNSLVQLIIKNKILQWQAELPYKFQLQAISLYCCPYCERLNGQVFEPEAVLRNPYFASAQCTKETGCSCGYIPVAAAENNQR